MNRYFIEDIKYGVTKVGHICGPIDGNDVVSVKIKTEKGSIWYNNIVSGGIYGLYVTEHDFFNSLLEGRIDRQLYDEHYKNESVYGIPMQDRESAVRYIIEHPDLDNIALVELLLILSSSTDLQLSRSIHRMIGRYIDELPIILRREERDGKEFFFLEYDGIVFVQDSK